MNTEIERNNTLNLFKGIACILIILIHIKFPGMTGNIISSLGRVGVPFFFMVSGYFSYKSKNNKKHISKTFKLLLISSLLFLLYQTLHHYIIGDLSNFYGNIIKLNTIKEILLFNYTPWGSHLWFLSALLYTYLIDLLIDKYKLDKLFYFFIPILLLIYASMNNLIVHYNIPIKILEYRNFIFAGIPFFMLGKLLNEKNIKINNSISILLIIIFTITTILERILIGECNLFFSTIPLTLFIFIYALNNPKIVNKDNILVILGDKYSLYVYIIHYLYIYIIKLIIYPMKLTTFVSNNSYIPILVIIVSIITSIGYVKLKERIKKI